MKNQIFLVLGGARSGKSEFAEKLMYHSTGKRKGYIATSQIFDDEMKYRVMLHRERRPADWKTFEVFWTLPADAVSADFSFFGWRDATLDFEVADFKLINE